MKTKEFISKMNDIIDVQTSITSFGTIDVYNFEGKMIGWVSVDYFGTVNTTYKFNNMKNKEEVIKLMFEYALTPLDEREDEREDNIKFQVKLLPGKFNGNTYLNQGKHSKDIFLSLPDKTDGFQTIFTKSEYNKLQQKYSEWLPKFNKDDPHFEFVENKNKKK